MFIDVPAPAMRPAVCLYQQSNLQTSMLTVPSLDGSPAEFSSYVAFVNLSAALQASPFLAVLALVDSCQSQNLLSCLPWNLFTGLQA